MVEALTDKRIYSTDVFINGGSIYSTDGVCIVLVCIYSTDGGSFTDKSLPKSLMPFVVDSWETITTFFF